MTKTKNLVVDLRRTKTLVTPVSVQGVSVDNVEEYKYLGVYMDKKLDWAKNSPSRGLRSFNICRTMLRMFYESVEASAIQFAEVCWASGLADACRLGQRTADANRQKAYPLGRNIVGMELDSLTIVSEGRMLSKIFFILDNVSHPLHNTLVRQRCTFSDRLVTHQAPQEIILSYGHQTLYCLPLSVRHLTGHNLYRPYSFI